MKKLLTLLVPVLVLVACSSDPARLKVNSGADEKINIDVKNVIILDRSGLQPADSPYRTNNFHPTIAEAIKEWAEEHFQAVGTEGDAVFIIKDAKLTAQGLSMQKGMNSWFTRQQERKYNARAEVEMEIKKGVNSFALASAQATRFETLPEDPSEAEKSNAYVTVLNGLMRDLKQNMDASVKDHLNLYIITAPVGEQRELTKPVIR